MFETEKDSPAKIMLLDWSNEGHYLHELVKELQEMERLDVVQMLQNEIEKRGEDCNCPICGRLT